MKRFEAIFNKLLLCIELPFYPILFAYLSYMLKTEERRRRIYLSTKTYVPLRRLHLFILDRMFVREVENYTLPSYAKELAGFIMDLKHLVANRNYIRNAFENNYRHTLTRVGNLLQNHQDIKAVIDIGCGSGVLTDAIQKISPEGVTVIGTDIRQITLDCNKVLYPDVRFEHADRLTDLLKEFGPAHVICILNGVVNFMTQQELEVFLSHKIKHIVWFYHSDITSKAELENSTTKIFKQENGYVHYNLGLFLKEHEYQFEYDLESTSVGGFVSGTSTLG